MALTAFRKGARYPYNNTGAAIPSGGVVVLTSGSAGFIGIALTAIPATTGTGELAVGGPDETVWTMTKHAGEAFTDAQLLYWDATNQRVTAVATGNTRAGRSFGTFASAATTANVMINRA